LYVRNIDAQNLSFTYRVKSVLKVKTDIAACCDTSDNVCWDLQYWCHCSYRWRHNVYDVIVLIGNVIMCMTSYLLVISCIRDSLLILTISLGEIKAKI